MLTQEQIKQLQGTLSTEDKTNLSSSLGTDSIGGNNGTNLYGSLGISNPSAPTPKPTDAPGVVKLLDNTLGKAGDFLLKNIVGAPVRAVGTMLMDSYANIKSSITGEPVQSKHIDTPFGKIGTLDTLKDTAGLAADAVSTGIGAFGGNSITNTIKNPILNKAVEVAATTGKDTLAGAAQGFAAGYNQTGSIDQAKTEAVRNAMFSGVASLAGQAVSSIAKATQNYWKAKTNREVNATLDNTLEFYPESKLGKNDKQYQDFARKRGLEYSMYAINGDKINDVTSWQKANTNHFGEVDNTWKKLVQSSEDAGTLVSLNKITPDDITNLMGAPTKLEPVQAKQFTQLVGKLQDGIITTGETDNLVELLNTAYEKASPAAQKITTNLKDDLVDSVGQYWTNQGFAPTMAKDVRDTRAALYDTKKMLEELAPKSKLIEAAVRKGNKDEAAALIDELYGSGLGIKNKPRIVLTLLKKVKDGSFKASDLNDTISNSFKYLNNNTLKNSMLGTVEDFKNQTQGLDVTLPEKGVNKNLSEIQSFEQDQAQYAKDLAAGKFKNDAVPNNIPTKEVPQNAPAAIPNNEPAPTAPSATQPPLNKTEEFTKIYSKFSPKQLQTRYDSLNKTLATTIRKQASAEKMTEIESLIEEMSSIEQFMQ